MTAISIDRAGAARKAVLHLGALLRNERAALADFLVALADFDRQGGWRDLGYTGLFQFLHRELRLSRAAAFYRAKAAGLVQRFPDVVEPLRDGRLCFTSVVELSKVLTAENKATVLPRFFHRSRQEAKVVAAELKPDPRPARRAVVTKLPVVTRSEASLAAPSDEVDRAEPGTVQFSATAAPPVAAPATVPPALPRAAAPRDGADPLTGDLRRLHVTVSKRFLDKLDAARAALSHALPGASIEGVLEAGLDLILAKDARRKGLVANPRPPPDGLPEPGDRYVPAAVRRAVWERDRGRCQWVLEDGEICGSTYQVELDHTTPVGQGGRSTVEGTRVLCKPHNVLAARLRYTDTWMDRFTRRMSRPVVRGERPCEPHMEPPSGAGPP